MSEGIIQPPANENANSIGWNPNLVLNTALTALAPYTVWDNVAAPPMTTIELAVAMSDAAEGVHSPFSPRYSWPMIDKGQAFLQQFCSEPDIPTWFDPNYLVGLYLDHWYRAPDTPPDALGTFFYVRFRKKSGFVDMSRW